MFHDNEQSGQPSLVSDKFFMDFEWHPFYSPDLEKSFRCQRSCDHMVAITCSIVHDGRHIESSTLLR